MNRALFRRPLAGLLLLAVVLLARPAAAADVSSASRLPPSVTVYLSVPNMTEAKARWKQSLMGRLIDDPELAGFIAEIKSRFNQDIDADLGISLDQLLAIPSGEFTLAMFQPADRPFGLVALVDFGKNRETVDKLLAMITETSKAAGAIRSSVEVDKTAITIFKFPQTDDASTSLNQPGENELPASLRTLGWFTRDNTLVLGNGEATLKSVLTRWDGKHARTLAENPVYRRIVEKSTGDPARAPMLSWYLDPIGAVRGAIVSLQPDNIQAQLVIGMLPVLGVDKLKAIGGSVDMATDRYDSISRTVIYVEPPPTGLLGALHFPAKSQAPPKWVPADTSSYMSLNWDIPGAWQSVANLVDSFNAPGFFDAMVDGLANDPNGPMLHLKKDLFDHLSGQVQVIQRPAKAAEGDVPAVPGILFALGLKNTAGMKATLDKMVQSPGFPGQTRILKGAKIVEMTVAGVISLSFSIANDQLMITNETGLLEAAIQGESGGKSLIASADYKRIAAQFPKQTSLIVFQKADSQLKQVYELIRSGGLPFGAPPFPGAPPDAPVPGPGGIDFSKLPPFSVIQKYFQSSGSYAVPDKDGAVIVSFSLKKSADSR